jgi:hypothetical protein
MTFFTNSSEKCIVIFQKTEDCEARVTLHLGERNTGIVTNYKHRSDGTCCISRPLGVEVARLT